MAGKKPGFAAETLSQRIHRVYAILPAGERKVADLLLDLPGDLAFRNASDMAAQVGVSNATVSRLFRRLDYASYEEARRVARAMRAQGSPLYLSSAEVSGGGQSDMAELLKTENGLIAKSLEALDPIVLDEIATRLAQAGKVRVAGFRNSRFLAAYVVAALAQFRPDVEMLVPAGQTLAEGIAGTGKGDLILVIGLRRRPLFFVDFVRTAASTGADVALLADNSVREAPALARWTISCTVDTPQAIDSYSGAITVLRVLTLAAIHHLGTKGHRYLARLETLHEDLSELE
jgi:DNA-binding MurR/RpiR family transcriptional regulator